MRHARLAWALVALAAGLATAAEPALTADNGTVRVTVTAEAPVAPCLTVSPGTLDFGTLPFSSPGAVSDRNQGLTLTNCGSADEHLTVVGTDASGAGATWQLVSRSADACDAGPNRYSSVLSYFAPGDTAYRIYNDITKTAAIVKKEDGTPYVFVPSVAVPPRLGFGMPCQGSDGAGQEMSFSATFSAIVA